MPGTVEPGREVGAELGFDVGLEEEEEAVHDGAGAVVIFVLVEADAFGFAGGGRPGNGLEDDERPDAVPHDLVCETEERDD